MDGEILNFYITYLLKLFQGWVILLTENQKTGGGQRKSPKKMPAGLWTKCSKQTKTNVWANHLLMKILHNIPSNF